MSRAARAGAPVASGCFAAFAVAALLFAHHYAVDWVYGDDLLTVGWLARIRAGTLGGWELMSVWDNQHPVGAQTALAWLLFAIVGVHFKAAVTLAFALILATAAPAWRIARTAKTGPGADVLLCLSIALLAFHPTQMEHLLWAFELGWFMVNACVVANAWLIERWRGRAILPVALLCLVAALSSAQGAFAWFAAALHVALRGAGRRWWAAIAALSLCGCLAVARIVARSTAIGPDPPLIAEVLAGLPIYALQTLGTALGTRNHAGLLVAGVMLLGLVGTLGLSLARRGGDPAHLRCAAVLIAFSALSIAAFARGRFVFGIDWALESFHAAPLLVPFMFGAILILAEAARDARRGGRITASLAMALAVLLAAGWVVSVPYGLKRARLWTMDQGYAAWAACGRAVPFESAIRAAGAEPYGDALAANLPLLSAMCGTDRGALASRLTREPALFRDLSAAHPEARAALSAVWQDYATELLLQVAFDPDRPDTPSCLLALAKVEAVRGPPFAHIRWEPFGDVLRALP